MADSLKTLIVDCDGVIADKGNGGEYAKADPLPHGIEQVNRLYDMGYEVVLYTARYGDRENGNINRQYERGYREWSDWVERNGRDGEKASKVEIKEWRTSMSTLDELISFSRENMKWKEKMKSQHDM